MCRGVLYREKPVMKPLFVILSVLLALLPVASRAQKADKSLERAILKTIKAYQNKDEVTLNGLIRTDFGLAFLYRRGVCDNLSVVDNISFGDPVPEYLPFDCDIAVGARIHFEALPLFSCDNERWNKPSGIYCDTTRTDTTLSTVAKNENEYLDAGWSADQIRRFEEIEGKSHKVIVIGRKQDVFIFYLTFIDNAWRLTVIDRFEVCSA